MTTPYDDTFTGNNGDAPDAAKWSKAGSPDIQNNTLECIATESVTSLLTFTGDFFVIVGFAFQSPAAANSYAAQLTAIIDGTHKIYISASRHGGGNYFQRGYINGGSWTYNQVSRTNSSGKLALMRLGTSFKCFYRDATGTWTELDTGVTVGSAGNTVSVQLYTARWDTNPDVTVRYDNFAFIDGYPIATPYDDTFTGADSSAIDTSKWLINIGTPDIQGNAAELISGEQITSKYLPSGNFNCQVDFAFQSPPATNSYESQLNVYIDSTHWFFISASYDSSKMFVRGYQNGGSATYATASRTNSYGSLKIIRIDNSFIACFKDGTGSWTSLGGIITVGSDGNVLNPFLFIHRWNSNPNITCRYNNYLINSGYVASLPSAPTDVSATDNLTDKVTITWTAGVGETDGHRVYRDGVDISGVVAHGTATFDDTTGTAYQVYAYTIKAINIDGLSDASTADNGTRTALPGWTYRKYRPLGRASGAVTNYQMKLLVGESSGSGACDFHCEGHCLSNFNDLRFTTSDGETLLDYRIESISGTTPNQVATVFVECDSIGTSDATYYVYYGNAGASAYSNGANTFRSFEDFSGDLSNWTGDTGSASITDGICTLAGASTPKYLYSANSYSGNIALRIKAKLLDANYSQLFLSENPSDATDMVGIYHDSAATNHSRHQTFKAGANTTFAQDAIGFGSYHIYEIMRFKNAENVDMVRTFTDGVQNGTGTTNNVPTVDLAVMLKTVGESSGVSADWSCIRQYVEPEPAWSGSWSAEETVGEEPPATGGGLLVGANPLVGGNILCGQGCLIN
ncbi:MAG: hypothetical protein CVU62_13845 [Deltaproteobacteria bacterium HGW-Deltaproteobacteria-2]|jgi:hypothetical protein|nr:MAG: hypothetical protein CVU62_13845 [Deltaproteobacteria bacterium HGW-Deltaproteobacteria-2]